MQLTTIMIALGTLSAQVYGAAVGSRFEGLPVTSPSWEVEVTPGGEKVSLSGTVQEVYAQLLKLNPNYDNDFPTKRSKEPSSLSKRDFTYEKYACWGEDGFHYLPPLAARGDNGDL